MNTTLTLMPNEYVRFEYTYKPGFGCFSSKTTTVTNMRLITHIVKTPGIFSSKTSTGEQKKKIMYLSNISNIKQLRSAIPSSQNQRTWWIKCINMLTCTCPSENIAWLELCHDMKDKQMDSAESTMISNEQQQSSLVERF